MEGGATRWRVFLHAYSVELGQEKWLANQPLTLASHALVAGWLR